MKSTENIIWLIVWGILTVTFGVLQFQGYDLFAMPSGATLSDVLTVISAILAGCHLGVLTIKGAVKVRHGAPGEVTMLAGLLRVGAAIGIGGAILYLFGQLGTVGAALDQRVR